MRNFRTLKIWRQSMDIVKISYQHTASFPKHEQYGLASQIRRCTVSIPSNIAEGCSRSSDVEYKRFLEIAIGSSFELETQLIIAEELEYLSETSFKAILTDLNGLQKQINALINKIKRDTC